MTEQKEKSICYVATTGKHLALFMLPQARYLAKNGWKVTVVGGEDDRLRRMLEPNMRYVVIPMKRGLAFFSIFRYISILYGLFKKEKYTFVQYFMPNAAFYTSIAAFMARVPFRYYQLGGLRYSASSGIKRRILMLIDKISCACSTQIVAVSPGNLKQAVSDGVFPAVKAKIIGSGGSKGVDFTLFDIRRKEEWRTEYRKRLGLERDDLVVGFAGSIRRDKGANELITAFRSVNQVIPSAKLLLIGDRDYFSTVDKKNQLYALNSSNVIFVPPLNGKSTGMELEEVPCHMACLDILGFPSYREGLPNVVLEAQALEIPVVVSQIPGAADAFLPGESGITVPVRNAEQLAEALLDLAFDSKKRSKMGHSGRIFVEKYFNQAILMEQMFQEKEAKFDY